MQNAKVTATQLLQRYREVHFEVNRVNWNLENDWMVYCPLPGVLVVRCDHLIEANEYPIIRMRDRLRHCEPMRQLEKSVEDPKMIHINSVYFTYVRSGTEGMYDSTCRVHTDCVSNAGTLCYISGHFGKFL